MTNALNKLDCRQVNSEAYFASVREASAYMQEEFYEKFCGHEEVIANCIGHTYIDVAWKWRLEQIVDFNIKQSICRRSSDVSPAFLLNVRLVTLGKSHQTSRVNIPRYFKLQNSYLKGSCLWRNACCHKIGMPYPYSHTRSQP